MTTQEINEVLDAEHADKVRDELEEEEREYWREARLMGWE